MGRALWKAFIIAAPLFCDASIHAEQFDSEHHRFRTEVLVSGLQQPFDMVFLPNGNALVSERRAGAIHYLNLSSRKLTRLDGIPENLAIGDAGMQGLALHPDYSSNGWIYFAYSAGTEDRSTTVVDRARLEGARLVDAQRVFTADAYAEDHFHYGARILFHDGYLFLTIGDRHHRDRAQDLSNHAGTILRLNDDGTAPGDNPFAGQDGARPEIWSYGHRHSQGIAINPETGELWSNEHGPRGGDEVNMIKSGANYGWPTVSWGFEYAGGPIGMGIVAQEGIERPAWVWTPAIAPSGMLFYTGEQFPAWRGSIFVGSLAHVHLNRLVIRGRHVLVEERLMPGTAGRVRFVVQGPDGNIYFGNDTGQVVRMSPID